MKQYACWAFAALALLWCGAFGAAIRPASAQECVTAEGIVAQVQKGMPSADIRWVSGRAAERLRAGISALIGVEVPAGGRYLIVHAPAAPTSYVVRFADACATHHGRFPDRLLRAWLDGSPA